MAEFVYLDGFLDKEGGVTRDIMQRLSTKTDRLSTGCKEFVAPVRLARRQKFSCSKQLVDQFWCLSVSPGNLRKQQQTNQYKCMKCILKVEQVIRLDVEDGTGLYILHVRGMPERNSALQHWSGSQGVAEDQGNTNNMKGKAHGWVAVIG